MLASLGKMPTTSARRLTSLFKRSNGLVECNLVRCWAGKARHVVLAVVHQRGELGPTWTVGADLSAENGGNPRGRGSRAEYAVLNYFSDNVLYVDVYRSHHDAKGMFFRKAHRPLHLHLSGRQVREDGRTKQRIIANLGRKEMVLAHGDLDRLARSVARLAQRSMVLSVDQGEAPPDVVCRRIGPALLFERLWHEAGCRSVLMALAGQRQFAFADERAVFLTVLHHLFVSGSDRAAEKWRADYRIDGTEGLQLHHLYRAMAWLGEPLADQTGASGLAPRCRKDVVEEALFNRRRDLFAELSVVFMDTTSLSFEGQGGAELGRRGHSKDFRPDLNQMIVGLVMIRTADRCAARCGPATRRCNDPDVGRRLVARPFRCRPAVRRRRPRHDQRRDHGRARRAQARIHPRRARARPCCTDGAHRRGDANPVWVMRLDIVRASEFKHPVQGSSSDGDFRGLGLIGTRSQGIADHAFISTDCCLDLGPKIVATRLLPAHPTVRDDLLYVSVPLCRSRVADGPGTAVARGGTMTAASG